MMKTPPIDTTCGDAFRRGIRDFAFVRDPRPLAEQLRAFAERGALAPESLSLAEIRMLCEDHLRSERARQR